jgi:truncated hemoglobin YjbI
MPGLYEALGGRDGCRKLSEAFYARVARDPVLSPLFPTHFRCPIESFAAFLIQFLGGPCEYSERYWSPSLYESHLRFKIGRREKEAWMKTMSATLDALHIEDEARQALLSFFHKSSAYLVNDSKAPCQATNIDNPQVCVHWNAQLSVDETVAAIRGGDTDQAIKLLESPPMRDNCARDRATLLSLLAMMSGTSHANLIDYVRTRVLGDPALARDRYAYGRTLLHGAAGAGSLEIVKLLLQLGADPNAPQQGGHPPLYCVGNECDVAAGGEIVRALAQAGANVNTQSGVKRCSALHMAARRGNVPVAEALLQCGANIEARDSMGDSPLRRAVNCGRTGMAAFLVAKGADMHSKGSKKKSALEAARTGAMKRALEPGATTQADRL